MALASPGVPEQAAQDPTKAEVPLPAGEGWEASLVLDNGDVGVWTVGTLKAFPLFALPEIFGLDDKGHCWLLAGYSGKWTPNFTVEDGAWLGALQQADVDPRVDGAEIYTGGKKGNLYQVVPLRDGGFDTRIIARFPSQEIHTLVAHDLMPEREGVELLVFTLRGEVYVVSPSGARDFDATPLANLEARVRQALVLDADSERPMILAACRTGEVELLQWKPGGLERHLISREPVGTGRIAVAPGSGEAGAAWVLYVTRDDGLVLRFEGALDSSTWKREVIYAGPQGPRGLAAGRFDADPTVETVAVFGYSKKVQLLSRPAGGDWSARTIFVDRDKGHWLASAELDGRNATTELIASGYGGRIVLLAREPGTGLDGVPTDPDPPERPEFGASPGVEH
ncbi:MAG: hypothetical protein DHS20C15_04170 [Planctomycetota bacterium]|nr:MAG: hypothetical protein DHS20C15_04170 [Planctomycetota bacterium]